VADIYTLAAGYTAFGNTTLHVIYIQHPDRAFINTGAAAGTSQRVDFYSHIIIPSPSMGEGRVRVGYSYSQPKTPHLNLLPQGERKTFIIFLKVSAAFR
jgi:hypothetical protein